MAAQIGYYDTLKSVAGKVFAYLASITLTGTDGKIITCTQNTSLDEAVAMSSKAPKTATIAGDGTAGRVLRLTRFLIFDGAAANSIKVQTYTVWNGATNAAEDNIDKPHTGTAFDLSADGVTITWKNGYCGGVPLAVLGTFIISNTTGAANPVSIVANIAGSDITITTENTAGSGLDWTSIIGTGYYDVRILYLTST